ncbi:sulfotransferase family 2 domain-containing protein [Sinirhodobacter huangdaonensis]|uniref:Sulfotransferase family protein n=1 Tax=Paenirhodobacter huangdaonensis TaxID=2501515 RepID=A0A443LRG8_9RHOB|nr:sulfotransferase family 2 domain-containing protein [Sinirhodobacter huangdaonensis]RWR51766.1 hypothetical protein EOW66_12385 [Sinirhodobacter huangdaonensis]
MKAYQKNLPLIYCHIPKMGGTSIRDLFTKAFGQNLFPHYNGQLVSSGVLISRRPGLFVWSELEKLAKIKPACIYGHFRRTEKTDTDTFYPEATQFATVLRNPAETTLSSYFYTLRKIDEGVPLPMRFKSVNEWLENVNSQIFNHMPAAARTDPRDFIRTKLVMAATLEKMAGLNRFMAENFSIKTQVPRLNESDRGETVDPQVLKRWISRNEGEMEFYTLVREEEARHTD